MGDAASPRTGATVLNFVISFAISASPATVVPCPRVISPHDEALSFIKSQRCTVGLRPHGRGTGEPAQPARRIPP
jgi:hypothetical protein